MANENKTEIKTNDAKANNIVNRNFDYIENLGNNLEFYLHYLTTMAKFHKYSAEDLASISIDAPQRFSAVASPKVWKEHFHRTISKSARGIKIVRDGKEFTVYDVSETVPPNPVQLWGYDDDLHKRFLDAVIQNDADTSDKIQAVTKNLFADSNLSDSDKEFAALSTSIVILERLNQNKNHSEPFRKDIERLRRHLANLPFEGRDYHTLTDTIQKNSQKVLDAFQQSVQSFSVDVMEAEYNAPDLSLPENNPLLNTLGVIEIPEVNRSAEETILENVAAESEVQEIEINPPETPVTKKSIGDFSPDDFVADDFTHPDTGKINPALLLNYKDDTEFDIDALTSIANNFGGRYSTNEAFVFEDTESRDAFLRSVTGQTMQAEQVETVDTNDLQAENIFPAEFKDFVTSAVVQDNSETDALNGKIVYVGENFPSNDSDSRQKYFLTPLENLADSFGGSFSDNNRFNGGYNHHNGYTRWRLVFDSRLNAQKFANAANAYLNNSEIIATTKKVVGEFSADDFVASDIRKPVVFKDNSNRRPSYYPSLLLNYKNGTEFDIDALTSLANNFGGRYDKYNEAFVFENDTNRDAFLRSVTGRTEQLESVNENNFRNFVATSTIPPQNAGQTVVMVGEKFYPYDRFMSYDEQWQTYAKEVELRRNLFLEPLEKIAEDFNGSWRNENEWGVQDGFRQWRFFFHSQDDAEKFVAAANSYLFTEKFAGSENVQVAEQSQSAQENIQSETLQDVQPVAEENISALETSTADLLKDATIQPVSVGVGDDIRYPDGFRVNFSAEETGGSHEGSYSSEGSFKSFRDAFQFVQNLKDDTGKINQRYIDEDKFVVKYSIQKDTPALFTLGTTLYEYNVKTKQEIYLDDEVKNSVADLAPFQNIAVKQTKATDTSPFQSLFDDIPEIKPTPDELLQSSKLNTDDAKSKFHSAFFGHYISLTREEDFLGGNFRVAIPSAINNAVLVNQLAAMAKKVSGFTDTSDKLYPVFYFNDVDNARIFAKALEKLFDNGHTVDEDLRTAAEIRRDSSVDSLTEEELKEYEFLLNRQIDPHYDGIKASEFELVNLAKIRSQYLKEQKELNSKLPDKKNSALESELEKAIQEKISKLQISTADLLKDATSAPTFVDNAVKYTDGFEVMFNFKNEGSFKSFRDAFQFVKNNIAEKNIPPEIVAYYSIKKNLPAATIVNISETVPSEILYRYNFQTKAESYLNDEVENFVADITPVQKNSAENIATEETAPVKNSETQIPSDTSQYSTEYLLNISRHPSSKPVPKSCASGQRNFICSTLMFEP